jgi:hypothetical protein
MSVIEVTAPGDDVEDLMDAAGRALQAWERQADDPRAATGRDRAEGDLPSRAARLRHQWRVDANAIIHSNRPRLGPWLVRMQTFVRRTTWWFLEPVIQQIRQYQRNSARVIEDLARQQSTTLGRVAELEARLALLETQGGEGPVLESDEA